MSIRNDLKEIRKKSGIRISRLAKNIRTTPASISRYENGKTDMLGEKLESYARYLGYEIRIIKTNDDNRKRVDEFAKQLSIATGKTIIECKEMIEKIIINK